MKDFGFILVIFATILLLTLGVTFEQIQIGANFVWSLGEAKVKEAVTNPAEC